MVVPLGLNNKIVPNPDVAQRISFIHNKVHSSRRHFLNQHLLSVGCCFFCLAAENVKKVCISIPLILHVYKQQLLHRAQVRRMKACFKNRKNKQKQSYTHYDPRKWDKTLELSKQWSSDSTPARNEVIMEMTYPVDQ